MSRMQERACPTTHSRKTGQATTIHEKKHVVALYERGPKPSAKIFLGVAYKCIPILDDSWQMILACECAHLG